MQNPNSRPNRDHHSFCEVCRTSICRPYCWSNRPGLSLARAAGMGFMSFLCKAAVIGVAGVLLPGAGAGIAATAFAVHSTAKEVQKGNYGRAAIKGQRLGTVHARSETQLQAGKTGRTEQGEGEGAEADRAQSAIQTRARKCPKPAATAVRPATTHGTSTHPSPTERKLLLATSCRLAEKTVVGSKHNKCSQKFATH